MDSVNKLDLLYSSLAAFKEELIKAKALDPDEAAEQAERLEEAAKQKVIDDERKKQFGDAMRAGPTAKPVSPQEVARAADLKAIEEWKAAGRPGKVPAAKAAAGGTKFNRGEHQKIYAKMKLGQNLAVLASPNASPKEKTAAKIAIGGDRDRNYSYRPKIKLKQEYLDDYEEGLNARPINQKKMDRAQQMLITEHGMTASDVQQHHAKIINARRGKLDTMIDKQIQNISEGDGKGLAINRMKVMENLKTNEPAPKGIDDAQVRLDRTVTSEQPVGRKAASPQVPAPTRAAPQVAREIKKQPASGFDDAFNAFNAEIPKNRHKAGS